MPPALQPRIVVKFTLMMNLKPSSAPVEETCTLKTCCINECLSKPQWVWSQLYRGSRWQATNTQEAHHGAVGGFASPPCADLHCLHYTRAKTDAFVYRHRLEHLGADFCIVGESPDSSICKASELQLQCDRPSAMMNLKPTSAPVGET